MRGPIGTILSWGAFICALGLVAAAGYGLYLLGWIAALAFGGGVVIFGVILTAVAHEEITHRRSEHAAIPARLAAINRPVPAVTGPVLTPEPLPIDIFTWIVRKQDDGRFAVLPLTRRGIELWDHTLATGLPWDAAWDMRNREQRAIGK
jgi:hypothetical protein